MVKRLSDVTYRIQLKRGSKAFVVHGDRLKPYAGETLQTWKYQPGTIIEIPLAEAPVEVQELIHGADEKACEEPDVREEHPEVSGTGSSSRNEGDVDIPGEVPKRYPQRERRLPVRYR